MNLLTTALSTKSCIKNILLTGLNYDLDFSLSTFNKFCFNIRAYVGYCGWLPPSPSSVPSFIPFPHFCQTDRDRSGPDLDCSSSKRNWLCSPKHGETELEQIQKELGDPDLRPEPICFQPSPLLVFPSSHASPPQIASHPS